MTTKRLFSFRKKAVNEDLALRIAYHCVRNTILEDYHTQGKISDTEIKAFNKEVANKIYTFLELVNNPDLKREYEIAFESEKRLPLLHRPERWDIPEIDKEFKDAINELSSKLTEEK